MATLRSLNINIRAGTAHLASDFRRANGIIASFEKRGVKSFQNLSRSVFSFKSAIAGIGIGYIGKQFLDAANTSEQFSTRLKVLLGSVSEGNRLFQNMTVYAGKVPFQFEEIMGAATQLSGVMKGGVDEITKWMPLIGDLAAASGLDIQQTTEQVIRMLSAGAAAADLFRERGITAMLGFQAGVKYSAEDTRKQLLSAWEDPASKFKGATGELAKTWEGQVSMMQDKWFKFRTKVMDSAPFDYLKAALATINERFTSSSNGIDDVANSIGQNIVNLAKRMALGTAAIIDSVSAPVKGIKSVINGFIATWNGLPKWVQEFGIVGAIVGGKKFTLAAIAILGVTKNMADWLDKHVANLGKIELPGGKKSIIEVISGTPEDNKSAYEKIKAVLDDLDKRVETNRKKRAAASREAPKIIPPPPIADYPKISDDLLKQRNTITKNFNDLQLQLRSNGEVITDNYKENVNTVLDAINQLPISQEKSQSIMIKVAEDYKEKMKGIKESGKDTFGQLIAATKGWGDEFTNTLADMVRTGKLNFKSLADSIISDLLRIAIYRSITMPAFAAVGLPGFANGGVMSSGGPMPLKKYASGGVASSPQMAIFGEGAKPEAYVPLPDGRSIPVKFDNAMTGTVVNNYYSTNISAVDAHSVDRLILSRPDAVAMANQKIYHKNGRTGGPYR